VENRQSSFLAKNHLHWKGTNFAGEDIEECIARDSNEIPFQANHFGHCSSEAISKVYFMHEER
jgi:hypothetical protein